MARDRLRAVVRVVLLTAGLGTYILSQDDVVWRFIKASPHARVWEHFFFGIAAAFLGTAFLLKITPSAYAKQHGMNGGRHRATAANLLRAVSIGSLLPLPGFLLLVLGEVGVSLFLPDKACTSKDPERVSSPDQTRRVPQVRPWRDGLIVHLGLFCAFISMIVFSIVLVDRVADVLFTITALISITASSRQALRGMANPDT